MVGLLLLLLGAAGAALFWLSGCVNIVLVYHSGGSNASGLDTQEIFFQIFSTLLYLAILLAVWLQSSLSEHDEAGIRAASAAIIERLTKECFDAAPESFRSAPHACCIPCMCGQQSASAIVLTESDNHLRAVRHAHETVASRVTQLQQHALSEAAVASTLLEDEETSKQQWLILYRNHFIKHFSFERIAKRAAVDGRRPSALDRAQVWLQGRMFVVGPFLSVLLLAVQHVSILWPQMSDTQTRTRGDETRRDETIRSPLRHAAPRLRLCCT